MLMIYRASGCLGCPDLTMLLSLTSKSAARDFAGAFCDDEQQGRADRGATLSQGRAAGERRPDYGERHSSNDGESRQMGKCAISCNVACWWLTHQQFQLDVRDDGRFNALTQELREIAPEAGSLELCIRSVLVLPSLAPPAAQALVLLPEPASTSATRRVRVDVPPDARAILLEEWTLALDRTQAQHPPHVDDPYPGVYKQAIALVRSLYALLRYVPAWQLHRKLGPGAPLHIAVGAALAPDALDEDVLGFGECIPHKSPTPIGAHTWRS